MSKYRTGYLFKRASNFYVRWSVEGKVFSKALRDDQGTPITKRREAEEARVKVMAPFTVADQAAALEAIAAKLEGRKAEMVRLDLERNPPLPITKAWREYLCTPNRPDTGETTLRPYNRPVKVSTKYKTPKSADSPIPFGDPTPNRPNIESSNGAIARPSAAA